MNDAKSYVAPYGLGNASPAVPSDALLNRTMKTCL